MPRIALVGCGEHARTEHAAALALLAKEGAAELVATCDLDAARADAAAREYGFARGFSDLDRLLGEARPDGLVVVMPVAVTADVAQRLLRRGIPCTVEKPPADTLAKTRALAEAAAASGTIHQVSLNRRFNPWLNRAIAWAREQAKPLAYLRTSMLRSRRVEADFVWATGFHVIDAMRHIAGDVVAYADRPMRHAGLGNWWHDATLEFAGGARGTLHVLPTCGHLIETYELFGDDWRAVVEIGRGLRFDRLRCWRGDELVVDEGPGDAVHCVRTGCYDEMKAFCAGVAAKKPMRPTLMDALPSAELAFALAARQGVI